MLRKRETHAQKYSSAFRRNAWLQWSRSCVPQVQRSRAIGSVGGAPRSRARRAPACAPAGAIAGRASRTCRRRRNRQAFARPWPCLAAIRATAFAEQSCKALSRAFESSLGTCTASRQIISVTLMRCNASAPPGGPCLGCLCCFFAWLASVLQALALFDCPMRVAGHDQT